jgi:hypothetical protein
VSLSLSAMDNGSWVVFELPGFTTAAAGAEQGRLAALRDARDTSYYKDGDTLWVKLVVANAGAGGGPGGGYSCEGELEWLAAAIPEYVNKIDQRLKIHSGDDSELRTQYDSLIEREPHVNVYSAAREKLQTRSQFSLTNCSAPETNQD